MIQLRTVSIRRVFYTDLLRPNDMGIMVHGVPHNLITLEPSIVASKTGTCPESCTQQVRALPSFLFRIFSHVSTHTYACTYLRYARKHACTHKRTHERTHACTHKRMPLFTHAQTCTQCSVSQFLRAHLLSYCFQYFLCV